MKGLTLEREDSQQQEKDEPPTTQQTQPTQQVTKQKSNGSADLGFGLIDTQPSVVGNTVTQPTVVETKPAVKEVDLLDLL